MTVGAQRGLTNNHSAGNVLRRSYALDYAGTGGLLSLTAEVPGQSSLSGTTDCPSLRKGRP